MPTAPIPFCPVKGCAVRSRGPCAIHRSARALVEDAARGSRQARGYDARWFAFRRDYWRELLRLGIVPKCGARLTPWPSHVSECVRQGRQTFDELELDHDPPLEAWERRDPRRVCDRARVGFLCKTCHTIATRRDQHAAAR